MEHYPTSLSPLVYWVGGGWKEKNGHPVLNARENEHAVT